MKIKTSRKYSSPIRQKQAEETKERIADTAEKLILQKGYGNTTIGEIAKAAGISPQTIYAVFGSKHGILIHLVKRTLLINSDITPYAEILDNALPDKLLQAVSRVSRLKSEEQNNTINSLGGFEMLYPELVSLGTEEGLYRRSIIERCLEKHKDCITHKADSSIHLDEKHDLLWALTDSFFYSLLINQCGWSSDRFEHILHLLLEFIFSNQTSIAIIADEDK